MRERGRQYHEQNKDHINETRRQNENKREYNKQYYQDKKNAINEEFACECGKTFSKGNKARHLKTQAHLKWASGPKETQNEPVQT